MKTFREALANIAKHARATQATVRIEVRAHDVLFEVTDDGVGPPAGTDVSMLVSLQEVAVAGVPLKVIVLDP